MAANLVSLAVTSARKVVVAPVVMVVPGNRLLAAAMQTRAANEDARADTNAGKAKTPMPAAVADMTMISVTASTTPLRTAVACITSFTATALPMWDKTAPAAAIRTRDAVTPVAVVSKATAAAAETETETAAHPADAGVRIEK